MFLSALKRLDQSPETAGEMFTISDGKQGIYETLRAMCVIVNAYKCDPAIRDITLQLTSGLEQKDYRAEVRNLFTYVRDNIRYVQDVSETEVLHTPNLILAQGAGDCDDKCILLASMLESINHKTRFAALGFYGDNQFTHVIVETMVNKNWVPLETTEPVAMGWYPPNVNRRMVVYN